MSRAVDIVILCEDIQTEIFVRAFLKRRGYSARQVHTEKLPNGTQSGEQWVRQSFPGQLQAIRKRERAVLLVFIDADTYTLDQRRAQLNDACREVKVPVRTITDRVLIAVPKRNIETWFAYLRGNVVDELTAYDKYKPNEKAKCHSQAEYLHDLCFKEQKLRRPAPPSLKEACEEYRNLNFKRSS